jgi:hypothetical protein
MPRINELTAMNEGELKELREELENLLEWAEERRGPVHQADVALLADVEQELTQRYIESFGDME